MLLTKAGVHSPLAVFIRSDSVSIWVMAHVLMSSLVAVRDAGPRTFTWFSGMDGVEAYACGW